VHAHKIIAKYNILATNTVIIKFDHNHNDNHSGIEYQYVIDI